MSFKNNQVKLESSNLMSVQDMKCSSEDIRTQQVEASLTGQKDMNNNSNFIFKGSLDKNSMESNNNNNSQQHHLSSLPVDDVSIELSTQLSVSSNDSTSPLSNSFSQCSTNVSNGASSTNNNNNNSNKLLSPATPNVNMGHIQINLNDSNQITNCLVCGDRATGNDR